MRNTVIRVLPMLLTTITLAACSAGYPPPDEYVTTSAAVDVAPPDLPAYSQPPCPGDGYLWTPGYWAWADGSYYWVAGAWVEPPQPGFLWTPGYWGWGGSAFVFHEGYWGEHVG
ncbi:MAG TPA: YXWGXW repeat-containing protein, partial [Gemmatimonadaceae bacterium]|nr:YXWGXW repeat-containing protein [Gemmatimonadaceae bacterium]